MPGQHKLIYVFQSWPDVGGCDLWCSCWFQSKPTHESYWFEVYHSPLPWDQWYLTTVDQWSFVGYEFWAEPKQEESSKGKRKSWRP